MDKDYRSGKSFVIEQALRRAKDARDRAEETDDMVTMTRLRPRRDINRLKAELALAEAEQEAKQLVKAPPNGKEKYLGNGNHDWERVANDTSRLRVPGGWIYTTYGNPVFVPIPEVVGYAV